MRVTKYPVVIVIITFLVTLFFGMQLPNIKINNDVKEFLPKNSKARLAMDRLEEDFGGADPLIVGYTVKNGDITTPENIEAIQEITEKLEAIDSVSGINSLTNIDYVMGDMGGIETAPLVEDIPTSKEEQDEIKRKLASWDIYKGLLYTEDFKSSSIIITTEKISQDRGEKIYNEIVKIVEPYKNRFDFQIAGAPVAYALMATNMQKDLSLLIPLVLLVVIITLLYSFKRISGVVLPLITVATSTIITLGIFSMLGIQLTLISTIIPVLLIAVGSAYGIHIISHYFVDVAEGSDSSGELTKEIHTEILNKTLNGVGQGVFLAAITTMVGFGSLATSKVEPIKVFGIFTAIGVFIAFIIAVFLIPALLQIKHSTKPKPYKKSGEIDALLKFIVKVTTHKKSVLAVASFLIIASIALIPYLKIGSMTINFFKKDSNIRVANEWLQKNSNGTVTLNMRFEAEETGGLVEPEFLHKLDTLKTYLKANYKEVGTVVSFADFIKKLNEVINADEEGNYYEIPTDYKKYGMDSKEALRPLISQYLMLFSGDLSDYVDDGFEPTVAKAVVQIKTEDVQEIGVIGRDLDNWLSKNLPDGISYELSGTGISEIAVTDLLVNSQTKSIIFSLVAVFIILALYFRSIVAGIIGMIALGVPVLLNFGIMTLTNVHLDSATSLVASIAIGIGIDYVIHFMNYYTSEMKNGATYDEAAVASIMASGSPILFNALSVAFGFLVLTLSQFLPLRVMGGMIAFTMITSSLTSLTILPVILMVTKPKYLVKNRTKKINK